MTYLWIYWLILYSISADTAPYMFTVGFLHILYIFLIYVLHISPQETLKIKNTSVFKDFIHASQCMNPSASSTFENWYLITKQKRLISVFHSWAISWHPEDQRWLRTTNILDIFRTPFCNSFCQPRVKKY